MTDRTNTRAEQIDMIVKAIKEWDRMTYHPDIPWDEYDEADARRVAREVVDALPADPGPDVAAIARSCIVLDDKPTPPALVDRAREHMRYERAAKALRLNDGSCLEPDERRRLVATLSGIAADQAKAGGGE